MYFVLYRKAVAGEHKSKKKAKETINRLLDLGAKEEEIRIITKEINIETVRGTV